MKILLVLCLCVLVVVSGEHKGAHSKRTSATKLAGLKATAEIHGDGNRKMEEKPLTTTGQNYLIPYETLLLKFRNAVGRIVYYENAPVTPLYRKALQKHRKQKNNKKHQIRSDTDELQSSLDTLNIALTIMLDSFEKSPEDMKVEGLNIFFTIFMNWGNHTDLVEYAGRLKTKTLTTRQENAVSQVLTGLKGFLSAILDYLGSCTGHETECLSHLVECIKERQEKGLGKKRYGPDHNYLLEAVQELAERLEAAGNPEDEDILLLAQAINHLFEDINILISSTPSVETNVLVTIDLYNVLSLVDKCKQDEQCVNDWYQAFGPEYYYYYYYYYN